MDVENDYLDVLQNIENAIIVVAHKEPLVLDYDIINALEALRRSYEADNLGRRTPTLRLGEQAQQVFNAVQGICEMRLGRIGLKTKKSQSLIEPVSCPVMIECLKRIEKSARFWNKKGGRRGYVEFVSNFIP